MFIRPFLNQGASESVDLLTDLVSWWRFEETTGTNKADSHGSNDLTATPSGTYGDGVQGNCWSNPTVAAYCVNTAPVNLGGGALDWTICGWIQFNGFAADQVAVSHSNGGSAAATDYMVYTAAGNKIPTLYVGNGAAWKSVPASTFGATIVDTWYFMIIEHDSVNQKAGISINNGTMDYVTGVTSPNNIGGDFYIGKWPSGNGMVGQMDEFGFWTKLLNGSEKAALYNSGAGITYTDI